MGSKGGIQRGEIVEAQGDFLGGRDGNGCAVGRFSQIFLRHHQLFDLFYGFTAQGNVDSQLIPVEVGVETGADTRMDLNSGTFDEDGIKSLDGKLVQSGSAIEQNRMIFGNTL